MQDISKLSTKEQDLVKVACEHAKKMFKEDFISVGGALRTKSGKIYTGINLKYKVRSISTCAEPIAIHTALNEGETEFDTVVGVKYIPDDDDYIILNSCGNCRQMYKTITPLNVIIDNKGSIEVVSADSLLPYSFD
jgi:cytidine deaminase